MYLDTFQNFPGHFWNFENNLKHSGPTTVAHFPCSFKKLKNTLDYCITFWKKSRTFWQNLVYFRKVRTHSTIFSIISSLREYSITHFYHPHPPILIYSHRHFITITSCYKKNYMLFELFFYFCKLLLKCCSK